MPWHNTPATRRASQATYSDPEYRANRQLAARRANGTCEDCGHRHIRLECDHDIPVTRGGTHALANLRMRCKGPGTCRCHDRKTASEGGGFRKPAGDPAPRPRTAW